MKNAVLARVDVAAFAIVQPYERMSVAEQKYILADHARERGIRIERFIGDDEVLAEGVPVLDQLIALIASQSISIILLMDGIEPKLPEGFCKAVRDLGGELRIVEHHKAILLTR